MTSATPVDGVIEVLSQAGYRLLPHPLAIAGLLFDLPAALIGENPSPDLVIVADTALEPERNVLRKIEGVARALDVARSRRPLTAILVGPRPGAVTIDAMTKVCRVLPIGVMQQGAATSLLENWLAVLLPLHIPEPNNETAASVETIIDASADLDQQLLNTILLAANGAEAIQERLHDLLNTSLQLEQPEEQLTAGYSE